jgi:hypothetical protein
MKLKQTLDYEFPENTVFKEMSGVINGISTVEASYTILNLFL